jgi:hypothetical protein
MTNQEEVEQRYTVLLALMRRQDQMSKERREAKRVAK